MRRRSIRLIAAKELLDTLRDRRTLFVALVLPLLLYPALLLGLTQIIGATQRNLDAESQRVLIDLDDGDALADLLRKERLEPIAADATDARLARKLREDVAALPGKPTEDTEEARAADEVRARLKKALSKHEMSCAVLGGEHFGKNLRADRQADATILFDSTDESSQVALRKVRKALQKFQKQQRERLQERFPDETARLRFAEAPVDSNEVEVASSSQKGAYSFAPLLGLLIVIMALTGAFYPAVDLAAGEKERGTLETLLVAPVTRTEIVLGKFLAVWVIAVVTALLNLGVMGLTFSKLAGMVGSGRIAFSLPLSAVATVSVILIPTAALFSAIALALSSFATSYKEGQHYMSPLFLVATPLAMVGLLPNVEIGYGLALVPISNVVLLVKGMLLGGEAAGPALVAFLAMAVYAVVALRVAVNLFKRESVLFRTGSGRSFDPAAFKASKAGLPREGQGILLFFVAIALMFYLSSNVKTAADAVGAVLKAQLIAVLFPTFLFARRGKVNLKRTFSLNAPKPIHVPLVILAALGSLVVILYLQTHLIPQRPAEGFEHVVRLIQELEGWKLFFLLAILPPICEELLCRGFLLSSFRPRFGWKYAVALSAILFGVLHLDLYRFPATAAAGLMLGYVCVRTRSIFLSMLFHMTYNGAIALVVILPSLQESLETPRAWLAMLGLILVTATVVGIERTAAQPQIDTD